MFWFWYQAQGFIVWDYSWWQWFIAYMLFYDEMPNGMFYPSIGAIIVFVAVGLLVPLYGRRPSSNVISGNSTMDSIHGSAAWATKRHIKEAGLMDVEGVTVGGYKKAPLRHNGPEHVLAFAPTRSGKGVGLVLNTLLEWKHSVVVLDIKGENYALTAGYRRTLGHRILRFEPTALEGSVKFNPLAEIRLGTPHQLADCQNIAAMIIDPDGKGLKDFWMQSGFEWLAGAILHVLYYVRDKEDRLATLSDVNRILSGAEHAPSPSDKGEEGPAPNPNSKVGNSKVIIALLDFMIKYDHGDDVANVHIETVATMMKGRADSELSGVHSSCKTQLSLYADEIISRNIKDSDFKITDLMNSDVPVALYIIIPPSDIDRLRPLVRVIFNVMLRRLTSEMKFEEGRSVQGYKHRLLLMLDEFTSVGKLDIFEKALAFMAGYGIKCYIIVQDLSQLQQAYGKEESIMSNCHIRIAYAPNKIETARTLSDMIGKITVVQEKRSVSGRFGSSSPSDSISETGRSLLTADEIMKLPGAQKNNKGDVVVPGAMIILVAGFPPILGQQRLYFMDNELLRRAKMPLIEGVVNAKIGTPKEGAKSVWSRILGSSKDVGAKVSAYQRQIDETINKNNSSFGG